MQKMNTHITKFVLAVTVPGLGRYQRKSVTTCDFAVPSALNGCARHTHKVTLATEQRRWLEVRERKGEMQTKTLLEYVEGAHKPTAYSLRKLHFTFSYTDACRLHLGTLHINSSQRDAM